MLHNDFQLEVFKRHLLSQPDKWQEIAIETFQNLLTSYCEYELLYQELEKLRNSKIDEVKMPNFTLKKPRNNKVTLSAQLLKYKLVLATQTLEQLQIENQELREMIKKIGLIIIDFIPKMSEEMAAKFDALIDEMVEK